MQGYDKAEALGFILKGINRAEFPEFKEEVIASLIREAIDYDLSYMQENGVLDEGAAGDAYYDDDEAFEYITDALCRLHGASEERELAIARLVDAYMDRQQDFMTQKGMIDWD